MKFNKKKSRNYFRICGVCGERCEQSGMKRDEGSFTGWICHDCVAIKYPNYDEDEY